ncbi:hypothetical protein DFR86_01475 [Acidianus sulfidivorans JP7]|uniref:Radical SAM protein n=1 Tax=Acidianus sulfidivorans JP7 TaxID=619593 RepID=A0A2U9IK51_9CREN|nr:hypothetical protein [Acidianus sulfidivorans]AWR96346.1 hypothetical protein DFR86_01475 [Acidianus sulfidivorans JP7]
MLLTSDEATFYSLPSLPPNLMPIIVRKNKYPPYGLRKIEALVNAKIVKPSDIEKLSINDKTIGIYVNDPLALTEVSKGLTKIFFDKPYFYYSFLNFSDKIKKLKEKHNLKIIVGGPGAWELKDEDWIDILLIGEAEKTLPKLLYEGSSNKIVYGEPAERFFPIRSPSAFAEIEVKRKNRKIPKKVIEEELKVQSVHGYVNLISDDFLSYGTEEEVLELLRFSSSFGKVKISQISVMSSFNFNFTKMKEVLKLNEKNWLSPVLSGKPGICTLDFETEILNELNKNFIYPMIYVSSEKARELFKYKAIIIPLPDNNKNYYSVLYEAWLNDKKILKIPFSRVLDRILLKTKETNGTYLIKKNFRGIRGLLSLFKEIVSSYISSS